MLKIRFKKKVYINPKSLISKTLEGTVEDVAKLLTARAKSEAPVRTGFLRSSIKNSIDRFKAVVYAAAHYAGYVEFGTYKQKANPYFRRAIDNVKRKVPSIIRKNWRKNVK